MEGYEDVVAEEEEAHDREHGVDETPDSVIASSECDDGEEDDHRRDAHCDEEEDSVLALCEVLVIKFTKYAHYCYC